jgi:hypothetical protein
MVRFATILFAVLLGTMLFQRGGKLSCLEVYAFGDHSQEFPLPTISTMRGWGQMSSPIRFQAATS